MAKKELKLHAVVSPTETVVVSAYGENGKAEACTLAFYMVSSHIPPCLTFKSASKKPSKKRKKAAMPRSCVQHGRCLFPVFVPILLFA